MKINTFIEKLSIGNSKSDVKDYRLELILDDKCKYDKNIIKKIFDLFKVDKTLINFNNSDIFNSIDHKNLVNFKKEIASILINSDINTSIEIIDMSFNLFNKIDSLNIDNILKNKILLNEALILFKNEIENKKLDLLNKKHTLMTEKDFLLNVSLFSALKFVKNNDLLKIGVNDYFKSIINSLNYSEQYDKLDKYSHLPISISKTAKKSCCRI